MKINSQFSLLYYYNFVVLFIHIYFVDLTTWIFLKLILVLYINIYNILCIYEISFASVLCWCMCFKNHCYTNCAIKKCNTDGENGVRMKILSVVCLSLFFPWTLWFLLHENMIQWYLRTHIVKEINISRTNIISKSSGYAYNIFNSRKSLSSPNPRILNLKFSFIDNQHVLEKTLSSLFSYNQST